MSSSTLSENSDDSFQYTDIDNPLAQSLLTLCALPYCPSSPRFFDDVPSEDQPRPLKGMPDAADYFVRKGRPLIMTFPAEVDLCGNYSRLGPYFSLPENSVNFCRTCLFSELSTHL